MSRFASLFDGLVHGLLFDAEFRQMVHQDLSTGQHRNPRRRPYWFTTAYFHLPGELAEEAGSVGLRPVELVGVEGLPGWLPRLLERWDVAEDREAILEAARVIEGEPSLAGLSTHQLLICQCQPP